MAISAEKWLVMCALAVASALLGFAPYFILRRFKGWDRILDQNNYHRVLTVLSCAGGGVLLATAFTHMLPENREALASYVETNLDEHFPLAEVLTLAGFCLIYLIEELASFIMRGAGQHGHSHDMPRESPFRRDTIARHSSMAHGIPGPIPGPFPHRASFLNTGHSRHGSCVEVTVSPPPSDSDSKVELTLGKCDADEAASELGSQLRSILALIALSFHAVMEGIAVGIQNSSNLWLMFVAVASHKLVISFCMGMELCASQARLRTLIGSILLFAVLSPLGIFIGSYLTAQDATKSLQVSVLEGFATGTILYVVFFEILSRERERRTGALTSTKLVGFIQFVSMVVGLVAMICLITLTGHKHADSHDHDEGTEEDHHH